VGEVKASILYKQGSQHEGVLQSRRTVWDRTVVSIQAHPWLGTGFGNSAEGDAWNRLYVATDNKINREHGSSYLEIVEWLGILGFLPFAAVVALLLRQLWRMGRWMRQTGSDRHPAVLLAAIVVAGLTHAMFEDWLLAVGYYLTVLFWPVAFSLMDLVPERAPMSSPVLRSRVNAATPHATAFADVHG
jgi:O-antigen ligase